jgi:formate hydrogenlyase subunit 6/NADH:ubiquinone oxidoreductase subunit I
MAIDEVRIVPGAGDDSPGPDADPASLQIEANKLARQRKQTLGIGLLKGLAVTLKHLFKHNTVIEYPDERQDLAPRTRGVIALKEENCTVCMLCARECPDWCIYIDSHKETLPPKRAGGRPRKRNVLDRFAIDYALCMYCGICVEVCPYDALFWSREFEYAEFDIRELTHEKERLSDWMATVLPPPELEVGAELPGQAEAAAAPAVATGAAGPGSAQRPSPPAAATAAAERPEQAARQPAVAATAAPPAAAASPSQEAAGETKETQPEGRAQATEEKAEVTPAAQAETKAPDTVEPEAVASPTETKAPETQAAAAPATTGDRPVRDEPAEPGPNVTVPHEAPRPVALDPSEDPEAVYQQVLKEQQEKGSSPQVAEARAKVARVKAERGIKRGPTPIETEKLVPSAPTKGQPTEKEPGGAPEAKEPQPPQGPVAPSESPSAEASGSDTSESGTPPPEASGSDTKSVSDSSANQASVPPAPSSGEAASGGTGGAGAGAEDPEAVYQRVLEEERAKGSSDAVAQGRAKAARVKAERAQKGGG